MSRVEANAKIIGRAKYPAEYDLKDIAYGVMILSTIAKGRILAIESEDAEKFPGVLATLSHLNAPVVPGYEENPASHYNICSERT